MAVAEPSKQKLWLAFLRPAESRLCTVNLEPVADPSKSSAVLSARSMTYEFFDVSGTIAVLGRRIVSFSPASDCLNGVLCKRPDLCSLESSSSLLSSNRVCFLSARERPLRGAVSTFRFEPIWDHQDSHLQHDVSDDCMPSQVTVETNCNSEGKPCTMKGGLGPASQVFLFLDKNFSLLQS